MATEETSLSRMTMQHQDGDAGMETMLWDFNIIPNELDYGYLMLPPGVLHMSALGRFGRFTLFSPRVSHSNTCRFLSFACFVFCLFVALFCFWFLFCKCLGIPNSPRSLDLDDRQGLIARSAMQQKKRREMTRKRCSPVTTVDWQHPLHPVVIVVPPRVFFSLNER